MFRIINIITNHPKIYLLVKILKTPIDALINFIAPHRCIDCSQTIQTSDSLCQNCWDKYIFIEDPLCHKCGRAFEIDLGEKDLICGPCIKDKPIYDIARSIFKYDDGSKSIIHKFKYSDRTYLANFFAKIFLNKYNKIIMEADVITFVPMHKFKRIFRLYNQAQVLATSLALIAKKELRPNLITKISSTKSQSSLSKSERKKNLVNNFKVNHDIKGLKILIIDDVISTGATVNECSKELKKAGAEYVFVLSIAKNYW